MANKLCGNNKLLFNTGAKGIIKIFKSINSDSVANKLAPPQFISKEYMFDYPLEIYKKDIRKIIEILEDLVGKSGSLVVTEYRKGIKITKFAVDYLKADSYQSNIDCLSFTAQIIMPSFTNTITLNINRSNPSNIISQSANQSWSQSAPLLLKEYLEQKQNKPLGFYKRYGLEINSILFLTLLVILPSLTISQRAIFMVGFLVFAISYKIFYRKISQTIINQTNDEPITFKDKFPIVYYTAATLFSAALGFIGSHLTGRVINLLLQFLKQLS